MVGSMDAALTKFVQTGKLSFKDLTRSIIQDLILIQMRAQASALFSRLVGGLIGNVGSGGFIGPGLAQNALPADFNQYLANPNAGVIPMMANGGPVLGNSPYIVGERGPELFVPQRSGMIVPTNQLANAMGGQTINYNGPYIQQMSAIDTQSGMQFLAQNKQAVWAANQSAQRSLPMSR
jgi:phage-related minor tail protein